MQLAVLVDFSTSNFLRNPSSADSVGTFPSREGFWVPQKANGLPTVRFCPRAIDNRPYRCRPSRSAPIFWGIQQNFNPSPQRHIHLLFVLSSIFFILFVSSHRIPLQVPTPIPPFPPCSIYCILSKMKQSMKELLQNGTHKNESTQKIVAKFRINPRQISPNCMNSEKHQKNSCIFLLGRL